MRFLFVLLAPLALSACAAESIWASDEEVKRAAYTASGPTTLTLYTAVNNRSNSGGHSALMINGRQRVIFDPAGSWWHRTVPERHDVLYGITPLMLDYYIDYHARETYRVVEQTITVSPEVAERAFQIAQSYGAVPKAQCASATSAVLAQLPGFEGLGTTAFPGRLMDAFAELPNVTTAIIYDDDGDDNSNVLRVQQGG